MKTRLKLIKKDKLNYLIECPTTEREYGAVETEIKIKFIHGQYQYIPRFHTFARGTRLSSEELDIISEELKRLNKNTA